MATVLSELEYVESVFDTKEFRRVYFEKVRGLMCELEEKHLGVDLVMFLYYKMNITFERILQLTQAACKKYNPVTDWYEPKILLRDPDNKSNVIPVPRLAPPRSKYEPIIKSFETSLQIKSDETGRVAFKDVDLVISQMLQQDLGMQDMPRSLSEFTTLGREIFVPFQFDATGFGSLQINTIGISNPLISESAKNFRVFGIGRCADDKAGTEQLCGEKNIKTINNMFHTYRAGKPIECEINGKKTPLPLHPVIITDTSALRHVGRRAASGFCGCSGDVCLRRLPPKPKTKAEMYGVCGTCKSHTWDEGFVFSHNPLPGETVPRPCTAPARNARLTG